MLLSGGRTKDLGRKIYFRILSITLVLKFKQSTKYFCKSKQHFLYAVYTKSFVLVVTCDRDAKSGQDCQAIDDSDRFHSASKSGQKR